MTTSPNTTETPAQRKTRQKNARRDRFSIREEVATMRRAQTEQSRAAAAKAISTRVLRPLKLAAADAKGEQFVATLVDGLVDSGLTDLVGIEAAIQNVAAAKAIPTEDLAVLTPEVKARLGTLA